jgi:predicted enzyme related to lactoylglutathione lyase
MMNRVVHFEISAEKPEEVISFYQNTFNWKFEKWEGPIVYWVITTGDEKTPGIDGGLKERDKMGTNTVNTIDVVSIDEYIEKVRKNGGEIIVPKMAVPGVGWFACFKDPQENVFSIMQSDKSAK